MHYKRIFHSRTTFRSFNGRWEIFVSHQTTHFLHIKPFYTLYTFYGRFLILYKLHFFSVHKGNGEDEPIEIPDVMFNTGRLRQRHFYDEILLTLTRQPLQQVDSAVTQGVSSVFFPFLSTITIQRNGIFVSWADSCFVDQIRLDWIWLL